MFRFSAWRAALLVAIASAFPLALGIPAAARQAGLPAPAVASVETPWLYRGSDVPQDPDWHFGVLPNGVRYAVRHNAVPPGQVAIRVRIDAGSLMEQDRERGFAHLIEHLSFRGSAHVADGESKRIWQRLGATFGTDTNAETGFTSTVYKLDLPGDPADAKGISANVDESLRILQGMVASPALSQSALDSERPVVLAEEREAPGPGVRLNNALLGLMFTGQPIAQRLPIGTRETLNAATPEAVQAFHDRWYRPERAVVIVVGDMDPAAMAQLVEKNFSEWKGIGPAPATPDFGKPTDQKPLTRQLVEPALPPMVTLSVARPWTVFQDTVIFNQKRMVDMVAVRIMNRRLEARARSGASYLVANASLEDMSRSANITTVEIRPLGSDWEAAVRDVRAVIGQTIATPPSQAEIDREVVGVDAGMKQDIATWSVEPGARLADNLSQAVDINETMTTAEHSYGILRGAEEQHMFTPEAVQASAKRLFEGGATRALLVTPAPNPKALTRLTAALDATVVSKGPRATSRAVSFAALPKLGPPGAIVARKRVLADPTPIEQVDFANGVKLLVYSSNAEASRVYVQVRFGAGMNALPATRVTPAWAANLALVSSGEAGLRQEELDAITNDRQIGFDFAIGNDAFLFGAQTTAADLTDQLKLFALKFAAPDWDPHPVERAKAAMLSNYAGFGSSPDGVLGRDMDRLLHAGDARWAVPSRADIRALTPARFRALWAPLLATGPIEVEVFGDVSVDAAVKAVAQTLGALKPRASVKLPGSTVRFPRHDMRPLVLTHSGQADQAAAAIAWPTGSGSANIRESRKLDVLAAVFRDRMIERLRSQAGLSYSPNVDSDWPLGMPGGGRIVAVGLVPAGKTDAFFSLARAIAADLVANPIGQDELQRTLAPMTQMVIRRSTGNMFWMSLVSGGTRDAKRIDAVTSVLSDVASTTPAEIQALAAKYLRPDKDFTLEVVPSRTASLKSTSAGKGAR